MINVNAQREAFGQWAIQKGRKSSIQTCLTAMGYTTFKNGLGIFEIDNYSEMVIAVQPLTTQFFSEQAVHGERDTELDRVFNYTAKKMRVVSLSGNH